MEHPRRRWKNCFSVLFPCSRAHDVTESTARGFTSLFVWRTAEGARGKVCRGELETGYSGLLEDTSLGSSMYGLCVVCFEKPALEKEDVCDALGIVPQCHPNCQWVMCRECSRAILAHPGSSQKCCPTCRTPFATTGQTCFCGASLALRGASSLYKGSLSVTCDICTKSVTGKVHHCPRGKVAAHPSGFDVCQECATLGKAVRDEIDKNRKPESKGVRRKAPRMLFG